MDRDAYIKQVASYFQQYAPQYGIRCVSAPTAQFCKESAFGTSELAVKAQNYAGIKLKNNRTPIAIGGYSKASGEFYDGNFSMPVSVFAVFKSLEDCVIGYLQFITNSSTYNGLQGLTDAKKYCELIAPYATSPTYSESLWNDYVVKYNLTQFDKFEEEKMIINVHAGHNQDGMVACGAVGLIKESTEARNVKDKVISYLRQQGHTVYDCTINDGISQSDILKRIVSKCNEHKVDVDISIHFNAGASDKAGDGTTTGTEVFVYNENSKALNKAKSVVGAIADLGFKNRGVKYSNTLYVLKNTSSPAMLIECCFVDDADDIKLYNADAMARAIVKGITGKAVENTDVVEETTTENSNYFNCPHCGGKIYVKA